MITVLLAEDDQTARRELRVVLDSQRDVDVVGEVADGIDAMRMVERFHPNVLVANAALPRLDGLELTRQVRAAHPTTQVVVVSLNTAKRDVDAAFASGAIGYLEKPASSAEL